MRILFGVLSLLIVLGLVGWLGRSSVETISTPVSVPMPGGTTQTVQPQQVQQQYQKALEDALDAARTRMPEE